MQLKNYKNNKKEKIMILTKKKIPHGPLSELFNRIGISTGKTFPAIYSSPPPPPLVDPVLVSVTKGAWRQSVGEIIVQRK